MLRILVRSTALNFASFSISAVLGFLTSGWTVATYGLHFFGIIAFARNLLPSGFLGIFDLGVPDAATRLVAASIARRSQREVDQYVSLALLFGVLCGLLLAVTLAPSAHLIAPLLMRLEKTEAKQFMEIAFWSAIAAFPLMVAQVGEGVLNGMNRFRAVRILDVFANGLFAISVLWITFSRREYVDVAYAYLASSLLRSVALCGWLMLLMLKGKWKFMLPTRCLRARMLESASLLWKSKLTSTASGLLPSFIIARMVGPSGVGVFDLLMRIPRLIKSVVGLSTQALIPPVAMLDAKDDAMGMGRLGLTGTFMVTASTSPLIVASMLASDLVLSLWLGKSYAHFAPWLALALAWPLLLSTYQVTNAVLTVKVEALQRLNRVNLLQLVLMLISASLLTDWLQAKAFIVAIVVLEIVFLPYRLWIYSRYTSTAISQYFGILLRLALAIGLSLGLVFLVQSTLAAESMRSIASIAAFLLSSYFMIGTFSNPQERRTFVSVIRHMAPM